MRAEEQLSLLVERTEDVAACLKELSGGKPNAAAEGVVKVLKGTSKSAAAKAAALEWLVGCTKKPRDESKGARDLAMAALRQSADSLRMAVKEYKQLKTDFMAVERKIARGREGSLRSFGLGWPYADPAQVRRWRERTAVLLRRLWAKLNGSSGH